MGFVEHVALWLKTGLTHHTAMFIQFVKSSVHDPCRSRFFVPVDRRAMETVRRVTEPSVTSLFSSMEYGPATESRKVA